MLVFLQGAFFFKCGLLACRFSGHFVFPVFQSLIIWEQQVELVYIYLSFGYCHLSHLCGVQELFVAAQEEGEYGLHVICGYG